MGWRSCSHSGAEWAARSRRAAGLRNLLPCQPVASGPVSASPSPTTQATIRVRVVEGGTVGMATRHSPTHRLRECEPGVSGATWLGMPPGNENCVNSSLQARFVLADVRVDLAVRPFEIGVGNQGRTAVPGTGDVEHVQVVALDDPIQVNVQQVLARRGSPVTEQTRLDVFQLAMAPSGADCPSDRSGRRTGSSRRASRRASCAAPRRKEGPAAEASLPVPVFRFTSVVVVDMGYSLSDRQRRVSHG